MWWDLPGIPYSPNLKTCTKHLHHKIQIQSSNGSTKVTRKVYQCWQTSDDRGDAGTDIACGKMLPHPVTRDSSIKYTLF